MYVCMCVVCMCICMYVYILYIYFNYIIFLNNTIKLYIHISIFISAQMFQPPSGRFSYIVIQ